MPCCVCLHAPAPGPVLSADVFRLHAPPANGRARRGVTAQSCFACQNAGTRCRTCTARDATASDSAASGPSQDSRVEPSATHSSASSSEAAASLGGSSAIPDQALLAEPSAEAVVEHLEGALSAPLRDQQHEQELDGEESELDGEESDGEESEATPKPVGGEQLLPAQYGPNTPMKPPLPEGGDAKRKRQKPVPYTAPIWSWVRRLKDDDLKGEKWNPATNLNESVFTHVCTKCWTLLKVGFDKSRAQWKSTVPIRHARKHHEEDGVAKKARTAEDQRQCAVMAAMAAAGDKAVSCSKQLSMTDMGLKVKPAELCLSKTARLYIYGRSTISKNTFEDPAFREHCQGYYELGGGKGEAPMLSIRGLKRYVVAEATIMFKFMAFMAQELVDYACGNPPMQNMDDAATLAVS